MNSCQGRRVAVNWGVRCWDSGCWCPGLLRRLWNSWYNRSGTPVHCRDIREEMTRSVRQLTVGMLGTELVWFRRVSGDMFGHSCLVRLHYGLWLPLNYYQCLSYGTVQRTEVLVRQKAKDSCGTISWSSCGTTSRSFLFHKSLVEQGPKSPVGQWAEGPV